MLSAVRNHSQTQSFLAKAYDLYTAPRFSKNALKTLFNDTQKYPGTVLFINRFGIVEITDIQMDQEVRMMPNILKKRTIDFAKEQKPGRIVGIFNDKTNELSLYAYSRNQKEHDAIKNCMNTKPRGTNFSGNYSKPGSAIERKPIGLHQTQLEKITENAL